jgi:S1-C subfamily serine protease
MSAFARSPFVAAIIGGVVVAAVLIAFDVVGDDGGDGGPATVIRQAPVAAASSSAEVPGGGLSAREIYERDASGVVFVRAAASPAGSPFGQQQGQGEATGTGFVIDHEGHVLTNHHVVGDARTVRVGFGEQTVTARVLGGDPRNDLALLQVDPAEVRLTPLTLGDSSSARVGDPVLAIGNPFGLDRTLTTGVVSALQRQITAPNGFTIEHVIQTDAPINPGNSGGPLLDSAGRVIGITSQIATNGTSNGSVGIGFAVPIDTARRLLPELERTGTVAHAYLGISGVTVDESLTALDLGADSGVLVETVYADGPAAAAGLRGGTVETMIEGQELQLGGDVIQSFDGRPLRTMAELTEAIARRRPGDRVRLGVLRDGRTRELAVTLGTAPRTAPSAGGSP